MRGASALGALLAKHPAARVRVLVVWEPVLDSDLGPPVDAVRAPLRDPRVAEYWDPDHWMSQRAMELARRLALAAGAPPPTPDQIAWDFVALYSAGARWADPFPAPSWHGEPVVRSLGRVEEILKAASQ
ncbi:MAG TPA: hypothetical protein VKE22_09280 [Haliangiales bacterium]|nr:hypothetical protein [Haliangiales bacterium]